MSHTGSVVSGVFLVILTGRERTHWVHPDLLNSCLHIGAWQAKRNLPLIVGRVHAVAPVDAARNSAVTQFLSSSAEWLLQIDNDVVPPPNLLAALDDIGERKIIGFPYGIDYASGFPTFLIGDRREGGMVELKNQLPDGWSQVDMVGAGCLLVHRSVFLAMGNPIFTGTTAEDFDFCDKARALGFSVWTHSGFRCQHHRTVNLSALVEAFRS